MRSYKSNLTTLLISLLAVAAANCAADVATTPNPDDEVEGAAPEVGVTMSELNQDIACGAYYAYPTWCCWGWTTVRFANRDASGTKILDVVYQAGAGAPKAVAVGSSHCEFEETSLVRRECEISQQWGGAALNVHNRGYWDVNPKGTRGNCHPCITPGDGPALNVNTL